MIHPLSFLPQAAQVGAPGREPLKFKSFTHSRFFSLILLVERALSLQLPIAVALTDACDAGIIQLPDLKMYALTEADWQTASFIVIVFTPFVKACESIGSQNGVVSSSVVPVLAAAFESLMPDPTQAVEINEMRLVLRGAFLRRFWYVFSQDSVYRACS